MPKIVELPSDEPLPGAVEPVLFGDCDVIGWAVAHKYTGMRDWMEGLGPYFAVELSMDGEVVVLAEYEEHPGQLYLLVRPELPEREPRSIEWLRALSISGSFTGTETGIAYST